MESRARLTVCCVTPEYRAKYPGAMVSLLATYVWLHGNEILQKRYVPLNPRSMPYTPSLSPVAFPKESAVRPAPARPSR